MSFDFDVIKYQIGEKKISIRDLCEAIGRDYERLIKKSGFEYVHRTEMPEDIFFTNFINEELYVENQDFVIFVNQSISSLIPGKIGMSENIEAISIVDNFLEHSRVYIFGNEGNPEVFISSADFMRRNLDGRVEVTCPIYDDKIRQELIDTFDIGWKGNVKARFHSENFENKYRSRGNNSTFRAQSETYNYYLQKIEVQAEAVN